MNVGDITEEEVYRSYERLVRRTGKASYTARQNVYSALRGIFGELWISQNARDINHKLTQIERKVTGRDCRADWRE